MPAAHYFARPQNMSFHNLCVLATAPPGCGHLLGLTQKFCIERSRPPYNFQKSLLRFLRAIRLKRWIQENPPQEPEPGDITYIPKLYVPSTFQPPALNDPNDNTELAIHTMYGNLEQVARTLASRPHHTNLTPSQHYLLRELSSDRRFVIVPTDKNLGPAIMDRSIYIERAILDHLGNSQAYERLHPPLALQIQADTKKEIMTLVHHFHHSLTTAEKTWFDRNAKLPSRTPQFYIMPKVHKTPLTTRPVVSCVGSFLEATSKWLDYQLGRLLPLSRTYIKDSKQLKDELDALGPLPANARLFTADAVSMYTNISIEHGTEVFTQWFTEFNNEIPNDFPTQLFLELLRIVMTRNVFQFGDTFWKQRDGTAMGTSCACMYATLYTALHERKNLIPKFQTNLYFLRRFIDDKFGIWLETTDQAWNDFQREMNNFGILVWKVEPLANEVDFLDLTIAIGADRRIVTKTYEKPMNLYLYIPPASAHPPGVLKSIVFGNLQRYRWQNSLPSDFILQATRFAERLIARGHSANSIRRIFMEAARSIDRIEQSGRIPRNAANPTDTLFFHWEYHPRGISRQLIRNEYDRHGAAVSGFDRMIVAFSRPRNLRDALMRSRLPDVEGSQASDVFTHLLCTGAVRRNLIEV